MSAVVQVDPAGRVKIFPFLFKVGQTIAFQGQNLAGFAPKGVFIVGDLTGTAITFQAAMPNPQGNDNGQTYYSVVDSAGAAVSVTVGDDRYVGFTAAVQDALRGLLFAKLVAGSAQLAQEIQVYLVCTAALT